MVCHRGLIDLTGRINGSILERMTQSKSTRQPDEAERRAKIDAAIEASVKPSPDSAKVIAELLGEQRTKVARRYHRRWIMLGGRWVRRNEDEDE